MNFKKQAKTLQEELKKDGLEIKSRRSLDIISKMNGFKSREAMASSDNYLENYLDKNIEDHFDKNRYYYDLLSYVDPEDKDFSFNMWKKMLMKSPCYNRSEFLIALYSKAEGSDELQEILEKEKNDYEKYWEYTTIRRDISIWKYVNPNNIKPEKMMYLFIYFNIFKNDQSKAQEIFHSIENVDLWREFTAQIVNIGGVNLGLSLRDYVTKEMREKLLEKNFGR